MTQRLKLAASGLVSVPLGFARKGVYFKTGPSPSGVFFVHQLVEAKSKAGRQSAGGGAVGKRAAQSAKKRATRRAQDAQEYGHSVRRAPSSGRASGRYAPRRAAI